MTLFVDTGFAVLAARGETREGSCVAVVSDTSHGEALIACADGLLDRPDPQGAQEAALAALRDSYLTAAGFTLEQTLRESLNAANQAVRGGGERNRAAAVSALALRDCHWIAGHAGHTRIWLYRDHQLKQITRDHITPLPAKRMLIDRACGLDAEFDPEITSGTLVERDIFVVASPAVHRVLDGTAMRGALESDSSLTQIAERLAHGAISAGSKGPVAIVVARVDRLVPRVAADNDGDLADLPVIEPPKKGEVLDGFLIQELVHKSARYRLYKARDEESGETVALKFPDRRFLGDDNFPQLFLREEWIGKRVKSPHLVSTLPLAAGRRTALYSVTAYHQGENLARRIRRKAGLPMSQALMLTTQLLDVLGTLHAQGIVHRDVRPNNMLFDKTNNRLLLQGLGTTQIEGWTAHPLAHKSSALAYLAPELAAGGLATRRSDIYATGVTLYRMLTGKYPYGKNPSPQKITPEDFVSPAFYKNDIPEEFGKLLRRACAFDQRDRFASVEEFRDALERASRAAEQLTTPSPPTTPHAPTAQTPLHWLVIGGLLAGLAVYVINTLR